MKTHIKIVCLFFCSVVLHGQDCFQQYISQAQEAYENIQFQDAINLFEAAKICPDNSVEQLDVIDQWLEKARNGYIDAIEKARDNALRSEQSAVKAQKEAEKQARLSEANRLAYLATQEMLKENLNDALPLAYLAMNLVKDDPISLVQEAFGNLVSRNYALVEEIHTDPVIDANFIGNSNKILSFSANGTSSLWSSGDQEKLMLNQEENLLSKAIVSPDETKIATADVNGKITIYNAVGEEISSRQLDESRITSIKFSPNSDLLVCGQNSGSLLIWNSSTSEYTEIERDHGSILDIIFSNQGTSFLLRNSDHSVNLNDQTGKELSNIKSNKHVYSARFSPNGKNILIASADGTASLVDLNGQTVQTFEHEGPVYIARFVNETDKIITADTRHQLRLWSTNGKLLHTFEAHAGRINGIDMSNDGSKILSWSADHEARISDMAGNLLARLDQHDAEILSGTFSSSDMAITTSRDQTAKLWNVDGELLMNVDLFNGPVRQAKFSMDNSKMIVCSEDGKIALIPNPKMKFDELLLNPPLLTSQQVEKYGLESYK